MEFLYKGVRGCAMTTPFDTAWALLKNEPYPLTPQEETYYEMERRAYEMAKKANPQPPDMTDEMYEEAIEEPAERIIAGMVANINNGISNKNKVNASDYPWPKKQPFQTTFLDRGNLSFDPMLSQQRKLNARMARESNRREAVPSQIKISPRENNSRGKLISLVNDEGETLSGLSGHGGDNYNSHIFDFYGSTPEPYRRQGMYRKLMQALIGAGIPIKSNERNSQSNAFHQNFLESLPPNIVSSYVDEYGNPRTSEPYLEGLQYVEFKDNTVEDLDYNTPLEYYQNKVPQFLDAQGQRSGLNRQDYGAIPIVNQQKQARNMDELAEQDRAKIRRGHGYIPEMVGIGVTQPMARNTTQSTLNLNSKFPTYNNLRPRPQQRDTTQQQNSNPPDDFYAQVQRLSQEGLENMRNQQ